MFFDICLVAGGLVLLFVGGEGLVRGSIVIAERLGLSKLLIGLVIVGFGTSMPELLVSLKAASEGSPDIALGNVIGSNTTNILLIFGVAILLLPIVDWNRTAVRDALIATLAALALFGFVHGDMIGLPEGVAFLTVLIAYLAASYWIERRQSKATVFEHETEEFEDIKIESKWLPPLLVVGGTVLLVAGAELLVNGSVAIARAYSVPEAVIGLSLVALGTSLPELATAIVAAIRKHSDVVLGNVIGSNIFNILAILGTTVVLHPISVDRRFQDIDAPVMLAASFLLLVLLFATKRIGRVWGVAMLAAYVAYMAHLYYAGVAV
jgi:cation:H+ antiporter